MGNPCIFSLARSGWRARWPRASARAAARGARRRTKGTEDDEEEGGRGGGGEGRGGERFSLFFEGNGVLSFAPPAHALKIAIFM